MNHQENQLAQANPAGKQGYGGRIMLALILAGLGVSVAYGYKKAGYVGSGIAVIVYYGLLLNLSYRGRK
jgi:hypothetical protein